jgi:hypothetical protein
MTEKENFMTVIKGGTPKWVPRFNLGPAMYATKPAAVASVSPSFMNGRRNPAGGEDIFGVPYAPSTEMAGTTLPKPGVFILDDIRKWRDVIKTPDISGLDWEAMAKKDLENMKVDFNETAVILGTHVGYFQHLMNFMGFTEGLATMFEEPEEVKALYDYLADFYDEVLRKSLKYYHCDIVSLTDDTAAYQNPFISPEMYRELVKPYHARLANIAHEAGKPVMMHNCGRCEDFIPDWIEFHISSWNPCQVSNDLAGIKKKYGNNLVLIGCHDTEGPSVWPGASEEVVRASVRECIDKYAAGGGYIFHASFYGPKGDQDCENKKRWVGEEYESYRETPYK